jgi:hypothetical protein
MVLSGGHSEHQRSYAAQRMVNLPAPAFAAIEVLGAMGIREVRA